MNSKRPINQDVPAPEPSAEPREKESKSEPRETSEPKPLAPKLLAALVILALAFIVVAVVAGSGGGNDTSTGEAPASTPVRSSDNGTRSSPGSEVLDFPSVATNNTTRIGGSDATSNAAAVALAVFPSTTPAQRPSAVTLVDEEDWAGAIAASVLMAPPVRAPVLFSTPDELPDATAQALEALDPHGDKVTGGASYFTVGSVAIPDGAGKTTRIDAGDPAATAAQIATLRERFSGESPKHVVVAPIQYPEYAMPAAAWAARSGDPILFTSTKQLSQPTITALKKNPGTSVFVFGPAEVVSLRAIGEIGKIVKEVNRFPGPGPGDVAIEMARTRHEGFGWNINDPGHGFVIVSKNTLVNAAAAAPLSASGTWGPLLLAKDPDRLPAKVRSYLLDVKPGYTNDPTRAFYNHVWLVGDEEEISVKQQAEVNELAELTKIGGGE